MQLYFIIKTILWKTVLITRETVYKFDYEFLTIANEITIFPEQ